MNGDCGISFVKPDGGAGLPHLVNYYGRALRFEALVPSAEDEQQRIVLCRDDVGELCYLAADTWRSLSASSELASGNTVAEDDSVDTSSSEGGVAESGRAVYGSIGLTNEPAMLVTSTSPASDKISLFKSLFRGRADVHAHGYRRKDGGIGYAPACANEFAPGICPKHDGRKVSCGCCGHRSFRKLTDRDLVGHFRGQSERLRDVLGMYVLLPNDTTWILAADFDDKGWASAARAFCDAARVRGLAPAVERSRSGKGAHVWLFFSEPVSARDARRLGARLLSEAMARSRSVGFDSFDRLFPSQDTVPAGGFGNLIALPLQGRAVAKGNSVFVDDDFHPYPDQWAYLSCVQRVTPDGLKHLLDEEDAVKLGPSFDSAGEGVTAHSSRAQADTTPAISTYSKPEETSSSSAMAGPVAIVQSDMLYVPEREIAPSLASKVRWLAAYANPEFYRAQAQRRSVYSIPRFVYVGETRDLAEGLNQEPPSAAAEMEAASMRSAHERAGALPSVASCALACANNNDPFSLDPNAPVHSAIAIPRGCKEGLCSLLDAAGVDYEFLDLRVDGKPLPIRFSGDLYPEQLSAARALFECDDGILSAPTGFGKTVIASWLIARAGVSTLVVVPKTALLAQWRKGLQRFLVRVEGGADVRTPLEAGQIGGGKNKPTGAIDIATFQSLVKTDERGARRAIPIARTYGMVIVDECHHAAAPQLEGLLKQVPARRVYGLSATPRRADGLDRTLEMLLGPIRYIVDPKEQARRQGFRRLLVTRFTGVRYPSFEPGMTYNQVLDLLCQSSTRNALIVGDVAAAVSSGAVALVLTKRRAHVRELARLLGEAGFAPHVIMGEEIARERKRALSEARQTMVEFASHRASAHTELRRAAPVHLVSKGDAQTSANADAALPPVIVATESCLGEGFDLPELTALFMATPASFSGVVAQQVGRLHRESAGKDAACVYDYVDVSIPQLERSYKRRLKVYASLGYEIAANGDSDECAVPSGSFVGSDDCLERFITDVCAAQRSIEVFASRVDVSYLRRLAPDLATAAERGIKITCHIARPLNSKNVGIYDSEGSTVTGVQCGRSNGTAGARIKGDAATNAVALLVRAGGKVKLGSSAHVGLAVFDEKIVWYGDLPLLAYPEKDACDVRIESPEAAHDLLGAALG